MIGNAFCIILYFISCNGKFGLIIFSCENYRVFTFKPYKTFTIVRSLNVERCFTTSLDSSMNFVWNKTQNHCMSYKDAYGYRNLMKPTIGFGGHNTSSTIRNVRSISNTGFHLYITLWKTWSASWRLIQSSVIQQLSTIIDLAYHGHSQDCNKFRKRNNSKTVLFQVVWISAFALFKTCRIFFKETL